MRKNLLIVLMASSLLACQNKDINEGEKFRPRELHDNFDHSHFTKVTVDGVEYLMMERDNNNPHEGFGFMAFRANTLLEKQDTLIAYLKAMQYFQNKIYSRMYMISEDSGNAEFQTKFLELLNTEIVELEQLEKEDLVNVEKQKPSED